MEHWCRWSTGVGRYWCKGGAGAGCTVLFYSASERFVEGKVMSEELRGYGEYPGVREGHLRRGRGLKGGPHAQGRGPRCWEGRAWAPGKGARLWCTLPGAAQSQKGGTCLHHGQRGCH